MLFWFFLSVLIGIGLYFYSNYEQFYPLEVVDRGSISVHFYANQYYFSVFLDLTLKLPWDDLAMTLG